MSADISAKFFKKVDKTDACWLWRGNLNPYGYGRFYSTTFTSNLAHRVSCELANGPIPAGLVIDHLCQQRSCVNPAHLEAVTQAVNVSRQRFFNGRAARTHCPQGHPYSEGNLYVRPGGSGRGCRVCRVDAVKKQRNQLSSVT